MILTNIWLTVISILLAGLLSGFITYLITGRRMELTMSDKAQRIADQIVLNHVKINHQDDMNREIIHNIAIDHTQDLKEDIDEIRKDISNLDKKQSNSSLVIRMIAHKMQINIPPENG